MNEWLNQGECVHEPGYELEPQFYDSNKNKVTLGTSSTHLSSSIFVFLLGKDLELKYPKLFSSYLLSN